MPEYAEKVLVSVQFGGPPIGELIEAGLFEGLPVVETTRSSVSLDFIGDAAQSDLADFLERFDDSRFMMLRHPRIQHSRDEIAQARWVGVGCLSGLVQIENKSHRTMTDGDCSVCKLPAEYLDVPDVDITDPDARVLKTNNGEWLIQSALLNDVYVAQNPTITDPLGVRWTVLRRGETFPNLHPSSTGLPTETSCEACGNRSYAVSMRVPTRVRYERNEYSRVSGDIAFSREGCGQRIENEHISVLPSRMLMLRGTLAAKFSVQRDLLLNVVEPVDEA